MSKPKAIDYDNVCAVRLRKLVEDTQTTQQELASELGVARQTVGQYLNGAVRPNSDAIKKIAEHFEVSADYIVGCIDDPTQDPAHKVLHKATRISSNSFLMLHQYADADILILNYLIERGVMMDIVSRVKDIATTTNMFNMAFDKSKADEIITTERSFSFGVWELSQYLSEKFATVIKELPIKYKAKFDELAKNRIVELGNIEKQLSERWAKIVSKVVEGDS